MAPLLASSFSSSLTIATLSLAVTLCPAPLAGAEVSPAAKRPAGRQASPLQITHDAFTGKVTVSWSGKGVLKESPTLNGRFKPTRTHGHSHTTEAAGEQKVYRLEAAGSPVVSANIVGYVNLQLPPGLSLIANPLLASDNTLGALIPQAADGTQVLKYVPGAGYEVSTFDGIAQGWTDPDMDLSPGVGFFFDNPSSTPVLQTFIGEVLLGTLVNHLPAGFSTKGALLPQSGSINTVQAIPGQPADVLRLYVNDSRGGGDYVTSVFTYDWDPDLILGIGQGFVIEKYNAQDWIRVFTCCN